MATSPASVLALMNRIAGKQVLSFQFTEIQGLKQTQAGGAISNIQQQTGHWLAGIGGDYWWYGSVEPVANTTFNAAAIDYAKNGGLITLSLSMPNPTTGGPSPDVSNLDAAGLLTQGTPTNNALLRMLDSIAVGLQELDALGRPVMLRVYHELNGFWFWWGAGSLTAPQFKALWTYTHDYLTKTKGLKNLLWIWAVNSGMSSMPGLDRYPGDAYVDLTGLDFYANNPSAAVGDYNILVDLGKPVCLAEFGSGGPSGADPGFDQAILNAALKSQMPNAVFWQQWWAPWGLELMQNTKAALSDPRVANRGDFSADIVATPTPVPTTTPSPPTPTPVLSSVLTPTSGGSIKDAAGNTWTLAAGGVVMEGTLAVAGGAGTSALTVVAGVIYGQDATSKLWWSNVGGAWSGPLAALPGAAPAQPTPTPTPTPVPTPVPTPLPPVTPVPPIIPPVTHLTLQAQIDQAIATLTAARAALNVLSP
jgi:mannan endo-1,4-beta-mannosidase